MNSSYETGSNPVSERNSNLNVNDKTLQASTSSGKENNLENIDYFPGGDPEQSDSIVQNIIVGAEENDYKIIFEKLKKKFSELKVNDRLS